MREVNTIRHVIVGLIICNVLCIINTHQTTESNGILKTDSSNKRSKRGLLLLVPSLNSRESESKNIEDDKGQISTRQAPITTTSKTETDGIFMRHNDMLDAQRFTTRASDSTEDDNDTSKPYIRMKSVTKREEILHQLAEARKTRRSTSESSSPLAIIIGRKINRPRGTRRRKYTCYCKETPCPGGRCIQSQNELAWRPASEETDNEAEDNSAEITDEPEPSPERKVTRMAEPTKFNIPFANNVNFDQRVILGHPADRSKYPIYPIYRNRPNSHRPYDVYQHDPHAPFQGLYTSVAREPPQSSDDYDDECVGMYGAKVCATMATSNSSPNDSDSDELANELKSQLRQKDGSKPSLDDYSDEIVKTGTVHTPQYKSALNINDENKKPEVGPSDVANKYRVDKTDAKGKTIHIEEQQVHPHTLPITKIININNADTVSILTHPSNDLPNPIDFEDPVDLMLHDKNVNGKIQSTKENKNQPPMSTINSTNENTSKLVSYTTIDNQGVASTLSSQLGPITTKRNMDSTNYETSATLIEGTPKITNSDKTESSVQSVDERPVFSQDIYLPNTDIELSHDVTNDKAAVMQRIMIKLINNFVPNNARDFAIIFDTLNFETESLRPEIVKAPMLKGLFRVAEVEDMLVDAAINLFSQTTGLSDDFHASKLARDALHDAVEQIAQPDLAPTIIELVRSERWITKRLASLDSTTPGPTREVLGKIESIISRSGLVEGAAAHPIARNLIVKAVKHTLDKGLGAPDEFAIQKAFNLIVRPQTTNKVHGTTRKDSERDQKIRLTMSETDKSVTEALTTKTYIDQERLVTTPYVTQDYSMANEPTKYFSPEDRILDYKKSHQSTDLPITITAAEDIRTTRQSTINKIGHTVVAPKATESLTAQTVTFPTTDQYIPTKYNLPIEPAKTSNPTETNFHTPIILQSNSFPSNFPYLGRLMPLDQERTGVQAGNLQNSKFMYYGDGVKLPVSLQKLPDGSFALTLTDKKCRNLGVSDCPCCLPLNSAGNIKRERRSGNFITKLSFQDDDPVSSDEIADLRSRRERRESGEYKEMKSNKNLKKKVKQKEVVTKKSTRSKSRSRSHHRNVKSKRQKYSRYDDKYYKNHYEDRSGQSLIDILKQIKNPQNRPVVRLPYKYQRYAEEDEFVRKRTNALKNVLYSMKNLLNYKH